jgi:signal peptidase I
MKILKYFCVLPVLGCAVYLFSAREMRFIYTDSESMLPSIMPEDRMIVLNMNNALPERECIVLFRLDADGLEEDYIKRVIGLPGDTVEIRDGKLELNGVQLEEPFLYEQEILYRFAPKTVPEGSCFLLGDNRNNSYDSSEWGFLPLDDITGKVVMIYWPRIKFLH